MTPRSDSETIRAARGQAAGSTIYFFTGTSQPALGANPAVPPAGTLEKRPTVMGTIRGDATMIIRGRDTGGSWRTEEDFKGTLIHECSHILVKSYGEHEDTKTDAASLDRYKDEFRAYFVEQFGTYAEEKDLDKRAAMIKKHLIGTSLADTRGYPAAPQRVLVGAGRRPVPHRHRQPQAAGRLQPHELDPARPLLHRARPGRDRPARRRRRGRWSRSRT